MLNILVVDDLPEFKVHQTLQHLKEKNIDFKCEFSKTLNEANRYIRSNSDKIDLILLDLGLPFVQDGEYDSLNGLYVLHFMKRYNIKIPVIINSTTQIPDEQTLFEEYGDVGIIVEHIPVLDGYKLNEFMQKYLYSN